MPYTVSRNGQTYGPYTLEDLQRYVASGNVLLTDMARSDEMPDWLPVCVYAFAQSFASATIARNGTVDTGSIAPPSTLIRLRVVP